MPDQYVTLQANDLEGLLPALDRRAVGKPHILDGRNFLWDAEGPYSGFGSRHLHRDELKHPELVYTFRVDAEIRLTGNDGIYGFDTEAMSYFPEYTFDEPTEDWPWSHAECGGKHYFCRLGVGVIEFDPAIRAWTKLTSPFLPVNPKSICASRGRLVVLGESNYAWSTQDDGTDFEPSLTTQAGAQSLSILGNPTGFMVFDIADGFLVYTDKGIIRAEFFDSQYTPFRHRTLTTEHAPISPFCIVVSGQGEQIFLDRKGFFQTNGTEPKIFEPLFSEYLTRTLLKTRKRDLDIYSVFRLHYAQDQQYLILSVAFQGAPTIYEYAYVLYRPIPKWGIFNRLHYSFGELSLDQGVFEGFNFGYIGERGIVNVFTDDFTCEEYTTSDTFHFWRPDFDMPARINDGVYLFPSVMTIETRDESFFQNLAAGFYELEEIFYADYGVMPTDSPATFDGTEYHFPSRAVGAGGMTWFRAAEIEKNLQSLNSYIVIGLFRWDAQQHSDQLGLCTNLTVGMNESQGDVETSEDWLAMPDISEDWLEITGEDEDWGEGVTDAMIYAATLIGTIDGYNVFAENEQILEARNSEGRTNFYPALVTGLHFMLKIEASQLNESFHAKSLELSGTVAGRL